MYAVWLLARAGFGTSAAGDGVAVLQLLDRPPGCAAMNWCSTHRHAGSRRQNVQREQRRVNQEGAGSLEPLPIKGEHDAILCCLKVGVLLIILVI